MNKKILLVLTILMALAIANARNETAKKYCGIQLVKVMSVICPDPSEYKGSSSKRSFNYDSTRSPIVDPFTLWKKIFNIKSTTKLTIPEYALQMDLLYGRCDKLERQNYLKNFLESKDKKEPKNGILNEEYTNDQLNNYLNYNPNDSFESGNSYKPMMLRYRRGIVEECCHKSCSLDELKKFCDS